MKQLFFVGLMIGAFAITDAQTEMFYPAENPVYSIDVPKGWGGATYSDYNLLELYTGDQSVVYSIYELDTYLLFEAINRADAEAVTEFYEHELGPRKEELINGITFHIITGSGITDNDEAFDIYIMLFRFDYSKFYMIYYSGLPEDIAKYRSDLLHLKHTLKPAR